MFARLFTILMISILAGPLYGQVSNRNPQNISHARCPQPRPVQFSFGDTFYSNVRQVSWQEPRGQTQNSLQAGSLTEQLERDMERRRKSLVQKNASTANDQTKVGDYQLPKLASVKDPIALSPLSQINQNDPSNLLSKQPREQELVVADCLTYTDLTRTLPIPAAAHWAAPNFYHRPLLFEETNLERYGNQRRFQNLSSAAHFLGTIPVLPYKIGQHPRCYREYTLKHRRPGDCVPYEVERFQFDVHGGFWQALVTAAIVIP